MLTPTLSELVTDKFSIDQGCVDVDIMVEKYENLLSDLLDKHASLKKKMLWIVYLNGWMTDNILALITICRKNEFVLCKTRSIITSIFIMISV